MKIEVGKYVFGAGSAGMGVLIFAFGDFSSVFQPIQALGDVPHRHAWAMLAATALVAGGALTMVRRTEAMGAAVLGAVTLGFASFWIPRVVGYPRMIGVWLGLAEEISLAMAAVLVLRAAQGEETKVKWFERAPYAVYGLCVMTFGLAHFLALQATAEMVPGWMPAGQYFWAGTTGVAHVLAGLAIATGIAAKLAARLLTLMIVLFGLLVWLPIVVAHPKDQTSWMGNAFNLAMAGAAWVVADRWASRAERE